MCTCTYIWRLVHVALWKFPCLVDHVARMMQRFPCLWMFLKCVDVSMYAMFLMFRRSGGCFHGWVSPCTSHSCIVCMNLREGNQTFARGAPIRAHDEVNIIAGLLFCFCGLCFCGLGPTGEQKGGAAFCSPVGPRPRVNKKAARHYDHQRP